MRIAHLIITHKNPLQLERLIKKMQHPNFDFYIHLDKKIDITDFEYLEKIDRVKFIRNRVVCNWGGYSTLQAMLNSLKEVLNNEIDYTFYNLLSAQDYPIKSNEEIYNFLDKNTDKSFIYYETGSDSEWWKHAVQRFQKYHLTDFNFYGKSFIERMLNKMLPVRKFPVAMKLYGGSKSSWWTINNQSANYLAGFFTKENNLERFLKFCWGTDEFVIPTILINSPFKDQIVNDNLRYIDFPDGKANPKILGLEDMSKMLESSMLFARKFDIDINADILDKIDEYSVKIK